MTRTTDNTPAVITMMRRFGSLSMTLSVIPSPPMAKNKSNCASNQCQPAECETEKESVPIHTQAWLMGGFQRFDVHQTSAVCGMPATFPLIPRSQRRPVSRDMTWSPLQLLSELYDAGTSSQTSAPHSQKYSQTMRLRGTSKNMSFKWIVSPLHFGQGGVGAGTVSCSGSSCSPPIIEGATTHSPADLEATRNGYRIVL
jgi:hypothetical protein